MDEQRYAERKIRVALVRAGSKTTEWRAVGSVTIVVPGWLEPLVIKDVNWVLVLQEAGAPGELRDAELRILTAFEHASWETTLRALKTRILAYLLDVLKTVVWVVLGFALHDPVHTLFNYVVRAF